MKFEKNDFKEIYISKYGETLDWDKLNDFAQYICQEQKEDIIDNYRKHSTSLDGTEYVNIPFINSVGVSNSRTSVDFRVNDKDI